MEWEPYNEPVLIVSCRLERDQDRWAAQQLLERHDATTGARGVYELPIASDEVRDDIVEGLSRLVAIGGGELTCWHYGGGQLLKFTFSA